MCLIELAAKLSYLYFNIQYFFRFCHTARDSPGTALEHGGDRYRIRDRRRDRDRIYIY